MEQIAARTTSVFTEQVVLGDRLLIILENKDATGVGEAKMASLAPLSRPVVLVVEDEPLIRLDAVDFIEGAGFEVLEAEDADAACAILASRADIRIVFTDINLAGTTDGLKLAATIRLRWPPVELVITSGRVRPGMDELPARGLFLAKPYTHGSVIAAFQSFG